LQEEREMQKTIGRVMVVASVLALAVGSTACSSRDGSESSATGITGPSSLEAKRGGGGGGKGGGGTTGGGSLTLVMYTDNNGDGAPNWGDTITFNVSTSATTEPTVEVLCSQNGVGVYGATAGFYDSYPWPWTKFMTLSSTAWSSGAADCTATLFPLGARSTVLARVSFTAGS
jgi:hypothetical protein